MSTFSNAQVIDTSSPLASSPFSGCPVTADHLAIANHAVSAIQRISRTFQGISDTSTSIHKPALNHVGDELTSRVVNNFVMTVTRWLAYPDLNLGNPSDVERFFVTVATDLNQGLTGARHGFWRTWTTPVPGQSAPEDIERDMQGYYVEFAERFRASAGDIVSLAAWNEKRLNAEIHPLSDGCGKSSKGISTILLGRQGLLFPQHESRDDYFLNINLPLDRWTDYYRSLVTIYQPLAREETHHKKVNGIWW